MKRLVLFMWLLVPAIGMAQEGSKREVRAFECEVMLGTRGGMNKQGADRMTAGIALGLELRYNYNKLLDFGLQLFMGTHYLHYEHFGSDDFGYEGRKERSVVGLMVLQPVVDYNFKQRRRVNPFVGVGVGAAIANGDDKGQRISPNLMPRAGVELWRHLRVTVDYRWVNHGAASWNACVGVVFGGGRKKG